MAEPTSRRVWFVTGGSGGLGRAIVDAAVRHGDAVATTVRSTEAAEAYAGTEGVLALLADVTDPPAVRAAVGTTVETMGAIDVLVNNAGVTLFGAVEEASDEQIRRQFETNVFGLMDVTRAVLPIMRQCRSGFVVNISSVAGVRGTQGMSYYAASKHAVEGFSEALAKEVAPLGIRVTIVEPGSFRTNALGTSMTTATPMSAYADTIATFREVVGRNSGAQPGDPARFGEAIVRLVGEPEPPLRLPLDPGATPVIRPKLEQQLRELDEWAARMATPPLGDDDSHEPSRR
jgi:NAD(P)-dependent dehydrogenase (short-subunit alcohol dehydrogenase family)